MGYFDATKKQQEAAMEFINRVVQAAQDKPVLIVAIPTAEELHRMKLGFDLGSLYWWHYLKDFASNNVNVGFLDLADPGGNDIDRFFHSCDEHWSAYGNKWVAEKISPILIKFINNL